MNYSSGFHVRMKEGEDTMHHHCDLFDILHKFELASERSLEPKLFPYYHIMYKLITQHHVERRARAQVHIISIFITHIMAYPGSDCCRVVIYDTILKDCWNLHVNSLGRMWMK